MSKFLFYFLFFSLNCKAPLNHWEMALNKFIIIIIIIIIIVIIIIIIKIPIVETMFCQAL